MHKQINTQAPVNRVIARLILSIAICILGLLSLQAEAGDDYTLNRSYFIDSSNGMNLEQVQQEHFTAYDGVLSGGYSNSSYWIKLRIKASTQNLILRIRPLFIDEVRLFDPADFSKNRVTGDIHPWSDADLPSTSLNFVLQSQAQPRDVYLRIKSLHSYLIYTEILPKAEFIFVEEIEGLIYSFYFTFALIIAIWLSVAWIFSRDFVLGIFALQQLATVLFLFLLLGYGRIFLEKYIAPDVLNIASFWALAIYPLIGALANNALLLEYKIPQFLRWILRLIIVGCLTVMTLMYFGQVVFALKLNAMVVLFGSFVWAIGALMAQMQVDPSQKISLMPTIVLKLYFLTIAIAFFIPVLPLLGIIQGGEASIQILRLYSIISGLMIFILLQYRAKCSLRYEIQRSSNLKSQADQERLYREEQNKLMSMLTHEIKTPLSVLKIIVDEKLTGSDLEPHANRALKNINTVIGRCMQLGKLDARELQVYLSDVNIQELIHDILIDKKDSQRLALENTVSSTVSTDKDLLNIILSNLIENAFKYSAANSVVRLTSSYARQGEIPGVEFVISNHIGIFGSPDPREVFKRYYRNVSATKISGSGLGLFLVRELVDTLRGTVTYQDELNQVSFRVWLPI